MFTADDIKRIREGNGEKFTASDIKAIRENSYKRETGAATTVAPSVSTPKTGYEIPAFNNYMENVTLPKMRQEEAAVKARASMADGTLSKPSVQPLGQIPVAAAARAAEADKTLSPATYPYTLKQRASQMEDMQLQKALEERSASERVGSALSGIGKTFQATPSVLWHTAKQGMKNNSAEVDVVRAAYMDKIINTQARAEQMKYPDSSPDSFTRQREHQFQDTTEAARAMVDKKAANAPVSMDTYGMRKMTEANQKYNEALEGLPGMYQFLGQTGISIADNALTLPTAVLGGPSTPLAIMGAKAAANKMYDLSAQGVGAGEAFGRGLVSGGIEAITEKIPLDNLLDIAKTGGRSALRDVIKQAGIEAGEETVSYLMNLAADKMAGDDVSFSAKEMGLSALGGAISGGVMGGGSALVGRGINAISQNRQTSSPTVQQNFVSQTLQAPSGETSPVPKAAPKSVSRKEALSMEIIDPGNLSRYQAEVDGAFTGDTPTGQDIILGKMPEILVKHGATPTSLHMTQTTARKIVYPEGYAIGGKDMGGKHNLGMSVLKQLPGQLFDPVAILKNPQENNWGHDSVVVLTRWKDRNGGAIIVPIHIDVLGRIGLQNNVASVFQANDNYLMRLLGTNNQNVLYTKNNESIHQLLSNGEIAPEAMADDVFVNNSIAQYEQNVNTAKKGPIPMSESAGAAKLSTSETVGLNPYSEAALADGGSGKSAGRTDGSSAASNQTIPQNHAESNTVEEQPEIQSGKGNPNAAKWQAERVGDPKETMRLSDIVAKIRHDYSIPVTTGHIRSKGTLGQYRLRQRGIRARIANDLPTIAHELGHHLDNVYGLTKRLPENLKNELVYGMDKGFREQYSEKEWSSEGLAEFVRYYLQNKKDTAIAYPEFTKHFRNSLGAEGVKSVDILANEINAYYAMDGETAQSAIRRADDKGADFRAPGERLEDMGDRFYQAWVDSNHGIKLFDEATGANTYKIATNSAYSDARAMAILEGDLYDVDGKRVGDGLGKAVEDIAELLKSNEGYDAFNEYLVVKHGPERLKEGMRIFADERKNNADWMNRRVLEIESAHPEFKEASKRLYAFQENFLRTWGVDTGLISEEMANSWGERWEHYVPLNRAVENRSSGVRKGFANQSNPIRQARGSGLEIVSPLDNIIGNVVRMVNAGTRNNVMLEITEAAKRTEGTAVFLERVPAPLKATQVNISGLKEKIQKSAAEMGISEDAMDNVYKDIDDILVQYGRGRAFGDVMTVMRKGKPEFWKINDPQLLESVVNLSPPKAGAILETLGRVNRFMQSNITGNNIVWSLFSNAPRDLMTAATYWPYEKDKNLLNLFKGIGSAYKNMAKGTDGDPLFLEYKAMGGGMTSAYTADKSLAKDIQKKLSGDSKWKYANPLEALDFVSNTVEMGPRYAVYRAMRERGLTPQEAFYISSDLTTNFRRGGKVSRELNKYIPFFNAGVQGIDHFARWLTAQDAPASGRAKVIRGRVSAYIGVSATLALLMWGLNSRDDEAKEDYAQLSNFVKNSYFNVPMGGGRYFAIPKPREIAVPTSLMESALEQFVNKNEHAFDDFHEYAFNQLLPNVMSDLAQGDWKGALGSTGVTGVFANMMANRDFLGRPIVGPSLETMENKDQYTRRNSMIAYGIGQAFNQSPQKIDYMGENILGGWWKAQRALFPIGGENRDLTLGVQNTYIKDNQYSTDVINRLYDGRDEAEKKKNSDPTNMEKAIAYKNFNNMTTFYSRYNQLDKTSLIDRETRQVVLNMAMEFEKNMEKGKKTEAQEVVEKLCADTGETDLMPSVMRVAIKDDNQEVYQLRPDQYVAYQLDYLSRYWEYIEAALAQSGNRKPAYLEPLLLTIKERAAEDAKAAMLQQMGVKSQSQVDHKGIEKYGVSLADQMAVKALIRAAGVSAKKSEQLEAIERGMDVSEDKAKLLWTVVRGYKFSAGDLDEDETTRYEYARSNYSFSEAQFLKMYNALKMAEDRKRESRIKALMDAGYSRTTAVQALNNIFDKPLKEMR